MAKENNQNIQIINSKIPQGFNEIVHKFHVNEQNIGNVDTKLVKMNITLTKEIQELKNLIISLHGPKKKK